MMDLTGYKYGRLVVVGFSHKNKHGQPCWSCVCQCGGTSTPAAQDLRRGSTKSCGCQIKLSLVLANTTHGHTKDGKASPENTAWQSMRARCSNPNRKDYARYGGRGVAVCDRWRESFENFLVDMGPKPTPQHSLDRINVNGNYEPGNCRWATMEEQARNKRTNVIVEWNGKKKTVVEWAEQVGVNYITLWHRIVKRGWPINEAMTRPLWHRHS